MNIETTSQLSAIRKILKSIDSGWLSMFANADGSSEMHRRVLSAMTADIHAQLSEAYAIALELRCTKTNWPDTAEIFWASDKSKPFDGVPDELVRSTLSRAKAVSSLIASVCKCKQEDQLCSVEDIDDAVWDVQGRVSELLQLLEAVGDVPAELRSVG